MGDVPSPQFCGCRERLHTGLRDGCRKARVVQDEEALLGAAHRSCTLRGSRLQGAHLVSLLPPVSLSRAPPPGRARQGARGKAETCEVCRVTAPAATLSIINACVWSRDLTLQTGKLRHGSSGRRSQALPAGRWQSWDVSSPPEAALDPCGNLSVWGSPPCCLCPSSACTGGCVLSPAPPAKLVSLQLSLPAPASGITLM